MTMVTLEEAARLALALPEVTEGQSYRYRTWNVAGKEPFREALLDGWLACAPPKLAAEYLKRRPRTVRGR